MAPEHSPLSHKWVAVVGAIVGVLTLVFFMVLVVLSTYGRQIPCESRFLVVAVVGFGAALSAAFLGGAAAARGAIPIAFAKDHPLSISVSGGIAVLVLLLVLSNRLFVTDCGDGPPIVCPSTYQSAYFARLDFGFCYPRAGWELDKGPIDIRAADIYLRKTDDHDIGIHFHVSLISPDFANQHDTYSQRVANTWRQLDSNLVSDKAFVSGRSGYRFTLNVKDSKGRSRPTEVIHIYLSADRLLEVISTCFEDSPTTVTDTLSQVRSSIVIAGSA